MAVESAQQQAKPLERLLNKPFWRTIKFDDKHVSQVILAHALNELSKLMAENTQLREENSQLKKRIAELQQELKVRRTNNNNDALI